MQNDSEHRAYIIRQQEKTIDCQLWSSCVNCEFWDKKQELCVQYGARPPATVIAVGCPNWLGEIPF